MIRLYFRGVTREIQKAIKPSSKDGTSVRWKLMDGQIFTRKNTLYQNPIHTRPNENVRAWMWLIKVGSSSILGLWKLESLQIFFCPNNCINYFCGELAACLSLSTTATVLPSNCHQIIGAVWTRETNCGFFWKTSLLFAKFLDGA